MSEINQLDILAYALEQGETMLELLQASHAASDAHSRFRGCMNQFRAAVMGCEYDKSLAFELSMSALMDLSIRMVQGTRMYDSLEGIVAHCQPYLQVVRMLQHYEPENDDARNLLHRLYEQAPQLREAQTEYERTWK
ncbi:MAG: hypothetical protein HZB66_03175 [Candidatus Aenigmarchaeota archaeon]|nr:hypothetical protein [Candidatus Aenigmarchaeota archaeon]